MTDRLPAIGTKVFCPLVKSLNRAKLVVFDSCTLQKSRNTKKILIPYFLVKEDFGWNLVMVLNLEPRDKINNQHALTICW